MGILKEFLKIISYSIIGGLISLIFLTQNMNEEMLEKDSKITYMSSFQGCFFGLAKKTNISSDFINDFCSDYADNARKDFEDVSKQMDEITDKKLSFWK